MLNLTSLKSDTSRNTEDISVLPISVSLRLDPTFMNSSALKNKIQKDKILIKKES